METERRPRAARRSVWLDTDRFYLKYEWTINRTAITYAHIWRCRCFAIFTYRLFIFSTLLTVLPFAINDFAAVVFRNDRSHVHTRTLPVYSNILQMFMQIYAIFINTNKEAEILEQEIRLITTQI